MVHIFANVISCDRENERVNDRPCSRDAYASKKGKQEGVIPVIVENLIFCG